MKRNRMARDAGRHPESSGGNDKPRWMSWLPGLLLVLSVLAAYLPVLHAGFIMDDDVNITGNSCVNGPLGLAGIWSTRAADYFPLTLSSFWMIHRLGNLDPLPYHLITLLFHAANALLLRRALLELRVPGSWFGAALWALHPVQVESVAWVSELKNTQSAFFFLLSVLAFLAWRKSGRGVPYLLSLACALLAMLSKSSTVMLPLGLCLCAWWTGSGPKGTAKITLKLFPFFALSALFALWTIQQEKIHAGAVGHQWAAGFPERLEIAGRAFWFYLEKLFWPDPLIFIYPRWDYSGGEATALLPALLVPVLFLTLWMLKSLPWCRATLFALAFFALTLFPVLGFFDAAFFRLSRVADHFQYLASMAPLALAGAAISRFPGKNRPGRILYPLFAPILAILLLLGFLTFRQCGIYRNPEILWNDTVVKNPNCAIAHNNLGFCFMQKGDRPRALREVETALSLDPDFPDALNNLGSDCIDHGDLERAISLLRRSVKEEPINVHGHFNLGNALYLKGNLTEAVSEYRRAIESSPFSAELHINLGVALIRLGNAGEGIAELRKAVELDPSNTTALNGLAWILATASPRSLRDGRSSVALAGIAVQRSGSDPRALRTLAAAYAEAGCFPEAVGTARAGIRAAKAARNEELAQAMEAELSFYEKHSPVP